MMFSWKLKGKETMSPLDFITTKRQKEISIHIHHAVYNTSR